MNLYRWRNLQLPSWVRMIKVRGYDKPKQMGVALRRRSSPRGKIIHNCFVSTSSSQFIRPVEMVCFRRDEWEKKISCQQFVSRFDPSRNNSSNSWRERKRFISFKCWVEFLGVQEDPESILCIKILVPQRWKTCNWYLIVIFSSKIVQLLPAWDYGNGRAILLADFCSQTAPRYQGADGKTEPREYLDFCWLFLSAANHYPLEV